MEQLTTPQIIGIVLLLTAFGTQLWLGLAVKREYENIDKQRDINERERRVLETNKQAGDMRLQARKLMDCMDKQREQFNVMMHNNSVKAQLGLGKTVKLAKVLKMRRRVLQFRPRGGNGE